MEDGVRGKGGAELTEGGGEGGEASLWPPPGGGGVAATPPVVVWPDCWEVCEEGGGDLATFFVLGVFSAPAACCFCCCRHLARRFLNHTCRYHTVRHYRNSNMIQTLPNNRPPVIAPL